MRSLFGAYVADETGAAAFEYALILAIIGASIGASAFILGQTLENVFNTFSQCLKNLSSC